MHDDIHRELMEAATAGTLSIRAPESVRESARLLFQENLRPALEDLANAIVGRDADLPAYAGRLPYPKKGEGLSTVIASETLVGTAARAYAAEVITATEFEDDQDPRAVLRAPGLLACSADTLVLAARVNQLKRELYREILQIDLANQAHRAEELRKVLAHFSLEQTCRAMILLPARPERVGFTWARATPASKRLPAPKVMELVEELKAHPPPEGVDKEQWIAWMDEHLATLDGLPRAEKLVVRQNTAPHPRANVRLDGHSVMRKASLPFLYPHEGGGLPHMTPLGVFDARFRGRSRRSDVQVEGVPLIPQLNIYRLIPGCREAAAEHPNTENHV